MIGEGQFVIVDLKRACGISSRKTGNRSTIQVWGIALSGFWVLKVLEIGNLRNPAFLSHCNIPSDHPGRFVFSRRTPESRESSDGEDYNQFLNPILEANR